MNRLAYCIIAVAALAASGTTQAAKNYCGELQNHYGPLDYRQRGKVNLEIVEHAHFKEETEAGVRGSTGDIGADLDYTLRAIPNHPRALATMGKLSIRLKTPQIYAARFPAECYFERGIRFAPDDGAVRAVYGNYLTARGRYPEALNMFKAAVEREPDNPTFNYNLGLLYVKMKQYDKAEESAAKAEELGFPLKGLRQQLAAVQKHGAPAK